MLTIRWLSNALFILAVPVFLVLSNVRIAAMEPRVYEYSFEEYDVPAVSGIPREQLDFAARDIVRYFADNRVLLATEVEVDGTKQRLFNERETLHMQDVKGLFQLVFLIHEVAFGYIAIYVTAVFLWAREQSLRKFASRLIVAGAVTAAALAVGALASLAGFDALFRQFHVLSFANNFWQLDPARDHLIQMFPRDFWFTMTLAVGVAAVIEGVLLVLLGYGLRAWVSRPRNARTEAPASVEATPQ